MDVSYLDGPRSTDRFERTAGAAITLGGRQKWMPVRTFVGGADIARSTAALDDPGVCARMTRESRAPGGSKKHSGRIARGRVGEEAGKHRPVAAAGSAPGRGVDRRKAYGRRC
jgi:hypothetical protein